MSERLEACSDDEVVTRVAAAYLARISAEGDFFFSSFFKKRYDSVELVPGIISP